MNKLIRNIRTLLVCSMAAVEAYALNPGDLALTRVTPTGVTVLALVDVQAGERILFTDQTWTFRGFVPNKDQEGEGIYLWEVPERPPSGGGTSNPDGSSVVAEGVGLAKGEQAEIEFPEGTIVIDWRDQLFLLSGVAEQVAIPRFPGFIYGIFTDQDWHLWTSPPRGLSNDISNIAIGAIMDAPLSFARQPRINHVIKSEVLETFSGELDHLGWLKKISEIDSWTWMENNPPNEGEGTITIVPTPGLVEFSSPRYFVREANASATVVLRRLYGSAGAISVFLSTATTISEFSLLEPRFSDTFDDLTGVAFGNGRFVTVSAGRDILISEDGLAWSKVRQSFDRLLDITFGRELFVAVGNNGRILTSADGETWEVPEAPVDSRLIGVEQLRNGFIAVGEGGTILVSQNVSTWQAVESGTDLSLFDVAFGNDRFVIVGQRGTILISDDALTWEPIPALPIDPNLWSVAYFKDRFVAVGSGGFVLSSEDGANWQANRVGHRRTLFSVNSFGDTLVAVGKEGLVTTANEDLEFNAVQVRDRSSAFFDVAAGNSTLVIVGEYGRILSRSVGTGIALSAAATDFAPIERSGVAWADGDTTPRVRRVDFFGDGVATVRKRFDLNIFSGIGQPDLGQSRAEIAIFNNDPPFNRVRHNYGAFVTFHRVRLGLQAGDVSQPHALVFRINNSSAIPSRNLFVVFEGSHFPNLRLDPIAPHSISPPVTVFLPETVRAISLYENLSNADEPVFKHRYFINSVFEVENRVETDVLEGSIGIGVVRPIDAVGIGNALAFSAATDSDGTGGTFIPQISGGIPTPPPGEGSGEEFGLVLQEVRITGEMNPEVGDNFDYNAEGTFIDPLTLITFEEALDDPNPEWSIDLPEFALSQEGDLSITTDPSAAYPIEADIAASATEGAPVDELGDPIPVEAILDITIVEPASNQNYESWRTAESLISGPILETDDFDNDGISNLFEFSLDLDPMVRDADAFPLTLSRENDQFVLRFTRPRDRRGVRYRLQTSSDLESWTLREATLETTTPTHETWMAAFTADSPLYYRFEIRRFDTQ